jgi:4-amino-4-deoxy-L-arabinose transferase-like glycosyltransferase
MKISFWVWLGLICLAAFLIIALFYNQITQHIPHSEDEVAYIFQAKVFALNRLSVPTPANADAFWTPFVLDYQGQRFGKYAIGWPLLLSVGFRLGAPWLINTVLAVATLAFIAWLGRCFYKPKIGLWAAALGLVTPGFLFLSGSYLSHTASLFWSTLALVFVFYLVDKIGASKVASRAFALAAGFSLGCAFMTRPFAALGIGLPIAVFLLVVIFRGEVRWTMLLWFIGGGLPVVVLNPLYWWAITGDPTFNTYLLVWPYDRVGFGPDIGPWGYDLYTAVVINTRRKLQMLATGLFGWPGWMNIIFLPIPFVARRANRWDWLLLGTVGGLVFVHIFYWAFGGADGGFPRYYYDALPAFLLLTVRGIQICFQVLRRRQWKQFQTSWLLVALLLSVVAYNLLWYLPPRLAAQKGKYNISPAPLQVVEQAELTEPALIIVKNATDWYNFAVHFAANNPLLDGPVVYAINWNLELTQRVR